MTFSKKEAASLLWLGLSENKKKDVMHYLSKKHHAQLIDSISTLQQHDFSKIGKDSAADVKLFFHNATSENKIVQKGFTLYAICLIFYSAFAYFSKQHIFAITALVHIVLAGVAFLSRSKNHWQLLLFNLRFEFRSIMLALLSYCFLLILLGPYSIEKSHPETSAAMFIMAILFAPFFEEIFFRDYLLHLFSAQKVYSTTAVIISSILFALVHYSRLAAPEEFLLYFIAAVTLAVLRWYANTLILSMFVHSAFNFTIIWL